MKRSLNEIEQTCRKAAKGCGMPWGIADEVGKAVRWLHMFGLDGCGCTARHLRELDHGGCIAGVPGSDGSLRGWPGGPMTPMLAGPGFCDDLSGLDEAPIECGPIACPLLAAGFLGQAALSPERPVQVCWQGVEMHLFCRRLRISGRHECLYAESSPTIRISHSLLRGLEKTGKCPVIGDTDIAPDIWDELEGYAYWTYVESTDANRLSGAGAGLADND